MNTIAAAPECDLLSVANGDFSRLSTPILIACSSQEQFEGFVFKNGLMCSEVRRLRSLRRSHQLHNYPDSKILLLLPGWSADRSTREVVAHWSDDLDRYTCQIGGNSPRHPKTFIGDLGIYAALIGILLLVVVVALVIGASQS